MRKPAALAALFPTVRGEVLAATLMQPEKWWYLSELAQFLGTSPSSLQRELKALVDGGILETRREGTRAYFKADTRSPVFPELRGLIDKTAGVVPTLQAILRPFAGRIACAFVYGSVARREEHAASDIDLLVVGDVGLADLTPALRKAEARLGREVNITSYSAAEFRKKTAAKEHFLSAILRGQKLFVKGDQREWTTLLASHNVQRHRTSKRELDEIRAVIERDLGDARVAGLSADRRFARRTTPRCRPRAWRLPARAIGSQRRLAITGLRSTRLLWPSATPASGMPTTSRRAVASET
ncbi:MAG TPA: nucleotidyltransferase domain-containing protein [Vicinamibacterales bacterium]|nr:nucleotidyltransferase domain-containing protein [Vicinamibacterales bacterium]